MTDEPEQVDIADLTFEEPEPESIGDVPPKRGRGRPKGSRNVGTSQTTASGQRGARRGSRAFIREQCVALVGIGNLALVSLPQTRADALDEREMTLLADALTAEAMSSERIMRWMMAASGITPHVLMIRAIVEIAIPRLQRRGILPAPKLTREAVEQAFAMGGIDEAQRDALFERIRVDDLARQSNRDAETESPPATDTADSAVPMAARPASFFDGGHR